MDMIKYHSLTEQVLEEIHKRELTYRELELILNISRSKLCRALTGKCKKPDCQTLIILLKFLKREDLLFKLLSLM